MNEIQSDLKKDKATLYDKVIDTVTAQLSNWKNNKEFRRLREEDADLTKCTLKGFDELECIFVHIPKSAGISINRELFGNLGGAHRTVRSYKRIFGPRTFKRYFKFTFIRNPYSRVLSAYRFLKNGGICEKDRNWAKQNLDQYNTFSDFINEWLSHDSIDKYIHFKPQHTFICDRSFEPEVDFIGRFEMINKDFKVICKELNINRELKKYNQGPEIHSSWQSLYTKDMLDKVHQIYRKDFELFGYSAYPM